MQVESTSKPMLTIDNANEETISTFEETDAAVDLRIKNSVCLVIDLGDSLCKRNFKCVKWVITLGMNTLTAIFSSSQQQGRIQDFSQEGVHL